MDYGFANYEMYLDCGLSKNCRFLIADCRSQIVNRGFEVIDYEIVD